MMRRITLVFAIVAMMSQFANADQVVMDFQDLEHVDDLLVDAGYVYTAGDWMVSHPNSEPFEFATAGTLNGTFYQGSTMLFNNTVNGVTTFERIDGGLFDMQSIDVAALVVGSTPTQVTFTSNNGDMEVFSTPDGVGGYTHVFGDDFNNVTSVSWDQVSSGGLLSINSTTSMQKVSFLNLRPVLCWP